jgi:heme-degrading monooxygenase HmoA
MRDAMRRSVIFALLFVAVTAHADVARVWRGRVPKSRADEYQKYLGEEGIEKIRRIAGSKGVQMFRRDEGDVSEFVVISYWPSREAIHAFAGDDIEKVHELPRDKEFLIDFPGTVRHYDIVTDARALPPVVNGWRNGDPATDCAGVKEPVVCAELLSMRDRDQNARHAWAAQRETPEKHDDVARIDRANLSELDAIVAKYGWPAKSLVGMKAAGGAWTVVQHNDHDAHVRYLPLLQKAADAGELDRGLYATFVDRVRIEEGKPQVYGSQFHEVNGELVPFPIEDEAHVDERRAAAGLQPLAEYAKQYRAMFGKK